MPSWADRFRTRQYLKGSLWVLPLVAAVLGVLLAALDVWLEQQAQVAPSFRYSVSTASGLLTAIVAAMVGLLGFVVTIGVLVVQMATGTLSPRFMRLWYRDRLQKIVLATFTATLTFSFELLRRIEGNDVPDVGVTIAGLMVTVSLILLLLYLDRFTHRLRPVAVAALVTAAGRGVLAEEHRLPLAPAGSAAGEGAPGPPAALVLADRAGALQAINGKRLTELASRHDCVLVLPHAVGDFVTHGAVLVQVHGALPLPADNELRGQFALGRERTIEQDPAFALRILVDVAIRALSPAVNDPTTAVQVLNHIEDLLCAVCQAPLPAEVRLVDGAGRPRVVLPGRTWSDYLVLAVTEIRDYGATSVQICRRLRALLDHLATVVPPGRRVDVERERGHLDDTVARSFANESARELAGQADRQGIGGPQWQSRTPGG